MRAVLVWLIRKRFLVPASVGFLSACVLALLANPTSGFRHFFVVTCGAVGIALIALVVDVKLGWTAEFIRQEAARLAEEADKLWVIGRRQDAAHLGVEAAYLRLSGHDRFSETPFAWVPERRARGHEAIRHGWQQIDREASSLQDALLVADELVTMFEETRQPFWLGFEREATQWRRVVARADDRLRHALHRARTRELPGSAD